MNFDSKKAVAAVDRQQFFPQKIIANTTRAYVTALTLVALLSTAAYFTLRKIISEHQTRAEIINLSGRQRMLSQRIGLLSEKLISATANHDQIKAELAQTVQIFEKSHKELSLGSETLGAPSESVKQIYFGHEQDLNGDVVELILNTKRLLAAESPQSADAQQALQAVRSISDKLILPKLDRVVQLNQNESDAQVERLHTVEQLVLLFTLALLVAEALFIFRPTIERVRKLIQDVLDASEKAIKATDDKSAFLATITHEIRTPLGGMWAVIETLNTSDLSQEKKDKVELLQRFIKSLMNLVDDILDYSKIESGKLSIESIDFHISSIVQDTYNLFLPTAKKKGIELIFVTDPQMPKLLKGDPTRIRQVITNFISNSIKFTPPGGEIQVKFVQNAGSNSRIRLKVSVEDTGCGIPREVQSSIFSRFEQGVSSTTRTFGGTGLGLAICKQLIEAMGGKIGFESQQGKGATFWFEVVLERGAVSSEVINALQKRNESKSKPIGQGFNLLLVEDNEDVAEAVSSVLMSLGFLVETASSGKAASAAVLARRFDIVLMDHDLPDMTGIEATRAIRHSELERDELPVPILALTGHGSAMTQEWQSLGVRCVLAKPIGRNALQKELSAHLVADLQRLG